MLASTFLDLVLGVDIHFEMVPTPVPVPTPIPNPFVGLVFDPAGLMMGLAIGAAQAALGGGPFVGPVLINNFPATNVGTEATNHLILPHILFPPGTMWAPMPKLPKPSFKGKVRPPGLPVAPEGDAIAILGSKTVTVMGASAVRMGDVWMSCSEPVRLPSSITLAIPKGPPVLIGGPPSVSLEDVGLALLRSRAVASKLHALVSRMKPGRLRNALHKSVCFLTGHPVDVASGRVLTSHLDWELSGLLRFERHYASSWANRDGPLGHGWSHSLDQAAWVERGKVVYLAEDGRELEFDTCNLPDHVLAPGQEVRDPRNRLTLRALGGGRYRITDQRGLTREFAPLPDAPDRRARLRTIRSRDEQTLELEYDSRFRLASARDSQGRRVLFAHDNHDRLTTIRLPHPDNPDALVVHTTFAYDGVDLSSATDPLGHTWRFAYRRHLLVQETDRNGLSFYFAYDGFSEEAACVRTWGDGGIFDRLIDHDKRGRVTTVTDSLGATTAYFMNEVGQVVKVMDALGGTTEYEYDPLSWQPTRQTDPLGRTRLWKYDARGNCLATVQPDGASVVVQYDDRDLPIAAVDEAHGSWAFTHDGRGRLTSLRDPLDRRTHFEWRGRPLAGVHDATGNVLVSRDVAGNETRRTFDAAGRPVRVVQPDGAVHELEYDGEGNPTRIRHPGGETLVSYWGTGRLLTLTENGRTTRFTYDSEGRISAVGRATGEQYRFERDVLGRATAEVGWEGARTTYRFDPAGQVVATRAPDGSESRFAYDAVGRVIEAHHSDGRSDRFRYRTDGALLAASNDDVTIEWKRDALGNVLEERQIPAGAPTHWVRHKHDGMNARSGSASSLGTEVKLTRDPGGQVVALQAGPRKAEPIFQASFTRDALGLERERHLPGGLQVRWERDGQGRPQRHTFAGQTREYRWDGAELRALLDSRHGPSRYRHEGGRLVIGEDDRGTTCQHDADGKLVRKEEDGRVWRYHWSADGLLIRVTRPDGDEVTFGYDSLARRIWKRFRGRTTRWLWDGDVPLHQWSDDEAPSTWLFEPGTFSPLGKLWDGQAQSIVTDHLGAPLAVHDASGAERWSGRLDLRGNATPSNEDLPWRWPGQFADPETGLHYNRHRYYDPQTGRYLSEDPLRLLGGFDPHGYVADPTREIDPLGLHVAVAFWDGIPLWRPKTGDYRWKNVKDSGKRNIPDPSGFGRLEDSENLIMTWLRWEHAVGLELKGHLVTIVSIWDIVRNIEGGQIVEHRWGPLPPCKMCGPGMQKFANEFGATILYVHNGQTHRFAPQPGSKGDACS